MKYIFLLPLLALVVTVTIPTTVYADPDEKVDPDEKADAQSEKGHVDQADKACQKGGYDGYIGEDCGYLN